MKLLFVGDPHATPAELGDCEKLIDRVVEVTKQHKPYEVVFLGDLYNTHAIIHVEVMAFWTHAFERIREANVGQAIKVLVGNHDMPGNDNSTSHALMAQQHMGDVQIIDQPFHSFGIDYIPYQSDPAKFVEMANEKGRGTLVCHQTFAGSLYENGFYAADGINPDLIPQKRIISGHIHSPLEFGKVWYPGAPRWRTLADANTHRAIWLVEFDDDDGTIIDRAAFNTGKANTDSEGEGGCREIRAICICSDPYKPGDELDLGVCTTGPADWVDHNRLDPSIDWRVDVRGTEAFVKAVSEALQGPGVRIRTFVKREEAIKIRESDGVPVAFKRYQQGYKPRNGTQAETLEEMAQKRLSWL